ncbi:hypothetical protein EKH55_5588 (plasmid) [Sinorhizobium alkalisoli]|nr:hypothetical protein EKH55_5588 [Sinorhizobium alkalisoli]
MALAPLDLLACIKAARAAANRLHRAAVDNAGVGSNFQPSSKRLES